MTARAAVDHLPQRGWPAHLGERSVEGGWIINGACSDRGPRPTDIPRTSFRWASRFDDLGSERDRENQYVQGTAESTEDAVVKTVPLHEIAAGEHAGCELLRLWEGATPSVPREQERI